jgi:hypothetical protein
MTGVKEQFPALPPTVEQESVVQALLSLHTLPLEAHPVWGEQLAIEHESAALQSTGVNTQRPEEALHAPLAHMLLLLHAIMVWLHPFTGSQESMVHFRPSSQEMGVKRHNPVAAEHVSTVHTLLSSHTTGMFWQPATLSQESTVHALPSLQFFWTKLQDPLFGLQESMVQLELSLQTTGADGTHEPLTGLHCWGKHGGTPVVQSTFMPVAGLEHLVQAGTVVFTQPVPSTHEPVMHPSPVLQSTFELVHPILGSQASIVHFVPSWHVAEISTLWQPVAGEQVSFVQALLSLQEIWLNWQPVVLTQESSVHALLSLHTSGACAHPVKGAHESTVQACPSSQLSGVKMQPVEGWQESAVHMLLSLHVIVA